MTIPGNQASKASILAAVILLAAGLAAHGEVKVTVGHNANDQAAPGFSFANVPSPTANNAAATASIVIVDGEPDPNGSGIETFNDGQLPDGEDQPGANFFFNAGTTGGRLRMDFTNAINIKQINTYSWHPNTRGPQVYKLYASDGTADGYNAAPKKGTYPETCGWKLIATVNTKAKNPADDGGQYGVSISDSDGVIGKYRHLLFNMASTEKDDDSGNTFYSEIDVIDADAPALHPSATTQPVLQNRFTVKTADGKCQITINTAGAPALTDWAEHQLAPVLADWYPKIAAMLPSDGFTAPAHFTLTIKPGDGVAYTTGTRVVANSKWLKREIGREAVGSLVHEMVHVVQHFPDGGPGWLVEGTADYIRWFKYEPQSHGADIILLRRSRNLTPHYDASYRISANFLNWVTEKYDKDIVAQLNAAMREDRYNDNLWKEYTGKTAPELGTEWQQAVAAQIAAPADGNSSANKVN